MTALLKIQEPGIYSTIQDLGRAGYQHLGVPVSGALDSTSFRLANALTGNDEETAAVEILFQGPTFEVCAETVRIALAGTSTPIEVLGETPRLVPPWQSLRLRRGELFRIGAVRDSAGCYLAIEGGFDLEPCLGSLSTYVRAGLGGLDGRPLAQGDELPLLHNSAPERAEVRLATLPDLSPRERLRVVLGPQLDCFKKASVEAFLEVAYRVSPKADRMGFRLEGPLLSHAGDFNIVSDGIATGAIQVPGSGQPIVLLADRQTTGGYPKIATVISADLPAAGRLKPGDPVRFVAVDVEQAEAMRRKEEEEIKAMIAGVVPVRDSGSLDLDSLYGSNLVSGVVSSDE